MADSNRQKALAEVITAEAWHSAFADGNARADLHVDVSFGVGRIGGGDPSGVRFRLSLKRAEIVVVVPQHEPVMIDTVSVQRDTLRPVTGKIETKAKKGTKMALNLTAATDASTKGAHASAQAGAKLSLAKSNGTTIVASQTFSGMHVSQSQTPEGHYRWLIEPALTAQELLGKPWDAKKKPRLKLVDQRPLGSKSMPPTVRVEVRCLREDLEISDIVLNDATAWAMISRRKAQKTRMVAAEAAIRTLLAEEGLVGHDLSDPYAKLTVAITTADVIA